mmetsp:Transcript_41102/g.64201  ORF Transcript_41102/g.64201 Transcript_41102/m.64201 type:complete len:602 (-) Transcript_41102:42-1847(-)
MMDTPAQVAMKRNNQKMSLLLMKQEKKNRRSAHPFTNLTNHPEAIAGQGQQLGSQAEDRNQEGMEQCENCGINVPQSNIGLHQVNCLRNNFKCPYCSELIRAEDKEAHLRTDDARIFEAVDTSDVELLKHIRQHGGDVAEARQNGNSALHVAVQQKCDIAVIIWLVEHLRMSPMQKNALASSAIDIAFSNRDEETLLYLTLAMSEMDTGSETTAAIAMQLQQTGTFGGRALTGQDRILQRLFELEDQHKHAGGKPKGKHHLEHMSPLIARIGRKTDLNNSMEDSFEEAAERRLFHSENQTPQKEQAKDEHVRQNDHGRHRAVGHPPAGRQPKNGDDDLSVDDLVGVGWVTAPMEQASFHDISYRADGSSFTPFKKSLTRVDEEGGFEPEVLERLSQGVNDDEEEVVTENLGVGSMMREIEHLSEGQSDETCLNVFFERVKQGDAPGVLDALHRWSMGGDEADQNGNTALHIASEHGYLVIVKQLLEQGFEANLRNAKGQTPMDLADRKGHDDIVQYISIHCSCVLNQTLDTSIIPAEQEEDSYGTNRTFRPQPPKPADSLAQGRLVLAPDDKPAPPIVPKAPAASKPQTAFRGRRVAARNV